MVLSDSALHLCVCVCTSICEEASYASSLFLFSVTQCRSVTQGHWVTVPALK